MAGGTAVKSPSGRCSNFDQPSQLQSGEMKPNPYMDKSAVWVVTGCMTVSPISGLRFNSPLCTKRQHDLYSRFCKLFLGVPLACLGSRTQGSKYRDSNFGWVKCFLFLLY